MAVCVGAAAQTQQGCPADLAQSITAQILDLRAHIGQLCVKDGVYQMLVK